MSESVSSDPQQYLSQGLKKPLSVAPLIMYKIFFGLVGRGRRGAFSGEGTMKIGAPLSRNMAGIWLRGRCVSFGQEEGGMWTLWEGCYVLKGGFESMPNSPQVSVAERHICDVNTQGADGNICQAGTVRSTELNWCWWGWGGTQSHCSDIISFHYSKNVICSDV